MKKAPLLILPAIFMAVTALFFRNESSSAPPPAGNSFRAEQKKHAKVRTAYDKKFTSIRTRLTDLGVDTASLKIFIRAFKQESQLEVWVRSDKNTTFQLYQSYAICSSSGTLGPKRCQGDGQVPEGFYHVNVFNPYSSYYLSLGVSYPNTSDKIFACKRDAGGAIMIHGDCVTIGCIPLTDDKIMEVYVLAVEARNAGQQTIPIHIFPAKLSTEKLAQLKKDFTDTKLHPFWDNLKTGYDKFESTKLLPTVTVDKEGKYQFK
jgi:murein L,D-transpeptidase YafK